MMCFMDRTYCNNKTCVSTHCSRHLKTMGPFALKHNRDDMPISVADRKTEHCNYKERGR